MIKEHNKSERKSQTQPRKHMYEVAVDINAAWSHLPVAVGNKVSNNVFHIYPSSKDHWDFKKEKIPTLQYRERLHGAADDFSAFSMNANASSISLTYRSESDLNFRRKSL